MWDMHKDLDQKLQELDRFFAKNPRIVEDLRERINRVKLAVGHADIDTGVKGKDKGNKGTDPDYETLKKKYGSKK